MFAVSLPQGLREVLVCVAGLAAAAASPIPAASVSPGPPALATIRHAVFDGTDVAAEYTATVFADGTLHYSRWLATPAQTRKLPPAQLARLAAAFDKADFFALTSVYGPPRKGDHGPIVESVALSYTRDGRTHEVHYSGEAPVLAELGTRIEDIVGTQGWLSETPPRGKAVLARLSYYQSGFDCGAHDVVTILEDGTIHSRGGDSGRCGGRAPQLPTKKKLTPAEVAQVVAAFAENEELFTAVVRDPPHLDHYTMVSIFYARARGTRTIRYEPGSFDPRARVIARLESRVRGILGTPR